MPCLQYGYRPNPLDGHPLDDPSKGSVGYFRVELQPGDSNQIDALLRGTSESGRKFAEVVTRANSLAPSTGSGRLLFGDNLLIRAKLMEALNNLLHEMTLAYQAHDLRSERRKHLQAGIAAADAVRSALDETKHGPFAEWYDSDRVFGLAALRASLTKELDRGQ